MRHPKVLWPIIAGLLSCNGTGGPGNGTGSQTEASYEVLELRIWPYSADGADAGFVPGGEFRYELNYRGVRAREPLTELVIVHDASGELLRHIVAINAPDESASFLLKGGLIIREEILKQRGPFRMWLEMKIQPTLKGASPWFVRSNEITFETQSALDALTVLSPSTESPLPYGTALKIQVSGQDLWDPVLLSAIDETGTPIPELSQEVPFAWGDTSAKLTWTISARALETVGEHPIRLVATFGRISVQSAPLTLVLTHTIDDVQVYVRDQADVLTLDTTAKDTEHFSDEDKLSRYWKLKDVKEIVYKAHGTALAGHEITINGGKASVATADEIVYTRVPQWGDYKDGKGLFDFTATFRSGGVERSGTVTIRRWGITDCGWFAEDGKPIPHRTFVLEGTPVLMRANTWGFPDTETSLYIFKGRQATFNIWESDEGRDLLSGPWPDDVDDFDVDIRNDLCEKAWTAQHEEEVISDAEMYFTVTIEDQSCTSQCLAVNTW